jgi:caffeoyl-CoA O-methyltransferase
VEPIHPLAAAYSERFSSDESPLLEEISQFTREHHAHAHMLSGQAQGAFLSFISLILRPRRILEIGTFTGYSALCLAEGLAAGGILHTIEHRPEDAETARGYFSRSSWKDHIRLHEGNALDILPTLEETWDLVFIDADKTNYPNCVKVVQSLQTMCCFMGRFWKNLSKGRMHWPFRRLMTTSKPTPGSFMRWSP